MADGFYGGEEGERSEVYCTRAAGGWGRGGGRGGSGMSGSVMQTAAPKAQQAAITAGQMPLEMRSDTSTGPTLAP